MAQATLEFSTSDALRAAVAGGVTITEITRSSTGWLDMVVSGYGLVALRGYAADERALMEHSDGSSLSMVPLLNALFSTSIGCMVS